MSTHRHLIIYKDSKHPLTLNPLVGRGNARGMFLHVVFAALLGLLVACHSHPSFRALDAQRHEADSLVEGLKTNESLDSLIRVAAKEGNHMLEMRARQQLVAATLFFLVFFLAFFGWVLLKDGYAVDATTGSIVMEPMKYLHNYLSMPLLLVLTVVGVALLLYGVARSLLFPHYVRGIWPVGIGVVLVVLSLLLVAGLGATAYYPSNADLQSSLTLANSCSSEFTLRTMFYVSLLVPFVVAYIAYVWRVMDKK